MVAPRLRTSEVRDKLESLEIQGCDCPGVDDDPTTYCEHVAEADHDKTVSEWAQMLRELCPEEYMDRPRPSESTHAMPGPRKVKILAERHAAGRGLWRPDDAKIGEAPGLGRKVSRTRQGRLRQHEATIISFPKKETA